MDGSRHIVAMAASAVRARVGRHWRIVAVAAAFVIAASTTAAQQRRPGRIGGPRPVEVGGLQMKNDGNNVSVDREARLLSENALRFQVASNLMRSHIRTLRSAIQEGKNG